METRGGVANTLVGRYALPPDAIEARSFGIIEGLLGPRPWSSEERHIAVRLVHATGDVAVADQLRVHPQAVEAGRRALAAGRDVFTDVNMVAVGISKAMLSGLGCRTVCAIDDPEVAAQARAQGTTRAIAAMRLLAPRMDGAIVAIGNAPTALLALLDAVDEGRITPGLIVGTPVGFVAAPESKAELMRRPVPYVTIEGTRGGSAVAAAIVNALMRLA